jgi:DNA repair and recombination protein RAD52
MTFSPEQVKHLQAPLNARHVAAREQQGKKLSYIEAWWAIAEANRIFGFDAWDRETVEMRCTFEGEHTTRSGKKPFAAYVVRVRVTVHAGERKIIREGCGSGSGFGSHLGEAHESALKEAESDAMKRALMTFGNPFGLALYDKSKANVVEGDAEPAAESRPAGARTSARKLKAADAWARIVDAIDALPDIDTADGWLRDYKSGRLEAPHLPSWEELPDKWREQVEERMIHRKEAIAEAQFDNMVGSRAA